MKKKEIDSLAIAQGEVAPWQEKNTKQGKCLETQHSAS